ncbi:hypothetical protein CMV30_15065 [Nibricoccus aquaticus]|uniref:Uncharacterized protein n=1 Tax=Nibricoccus aquaticus TaxID=2576891 RepID=A0A290QA84_9BACT|nr:hypothetical protein [Nibricoccus aquaticus]ATC65167.1 hypothetical protein CMV30_15065 [Nibricoccus aquaticus]
MEEPDPLTVQAAVKIAEAYEALVKATFFLNFRKESKQLQAIASYLEKVADQLKAGNRNAGLALELVDRKWAARILGTNGSAEKKRSLIKAREALARKRHFQRTGQVAGTETLDVPYSTQTGQPSATPLLTT